MNIKIVFSQNGKSLHEIMLQNIQQIVDTEWYLMHSNSTANGFNREYIQDEKLHIQNKHIEAR